MKALPKEVLIHDWPIKQAASSQANIIVFPEIFITGSTKRNKVFTDSEHKYRGHFQYLAKNMKLILFLGRS